MSKYFSIYKEKKTGGQKEKKDDKDKDKDHSGRGTRAAAEHTGKRRDILYLDTKQHREDRGQKKDKRKRERERE